jgi:hypothetical protein
MHEYSPMNTIHLTLPHIPVSLLLALPILVAIVGSAAWRFVSGRKSRFRDRLESAFSRYDRP